MSYELLSLSRKLNKRRGLNKSGRVGKLKKKKAGGRLLGTREYVFLQFLSKFARKASAGASFSIKLQHIGHQLY